jgi:hypothetical protein
MNGHVSTSMVLLMVGLVGRKGTFRPYSIAGCCSVRRGIKIQHQSSCLQFAKKERKEEKKRSES